MMRLNVDSSTYVGPRTLKEAYSDPKVDVQAYGRQLGAWLATLHSSTKAIDIGDNVTAKGIYRFAYNNLADTAQSFGLDSAIGERINEEYGSLLATDNDCVCHGRFRSIMYAHPRSPYFSS